MNVKTTSDLKALRQLLGLTTGEAAELMGESRRWIMDAERGRTFAISSTYRDALLRWEATVQDFIDEVAESGDKWIIVYPTVDVFREFEPKWSKRFPTHLMHMQAASRAASEGQEQGLSVVTMFPIAFEEYLEKTGKEDSRQTRQEWAAAFARSYYVREEEST